MGYHSTTPFLSEAGRIGEPSPACLAIPKKFDKAGKRGLTTGKVTCAKREDAATILSGVVKRAVEMLDKVIDRLIAAREAICSGKPTSVLAPGDLMGCWLRYRLSVCIDDPAVWFKGTFESRSVAEVIRRLVRPRNLLASNRITYVCEDSCPSESSHARVFATKNGVCIPKPNEVIYLCPPFWYPLNARFREMTLIHEAVHLTHCAATEDEGTRVTIGSPECLAQFVAAVNGKDLDPAFKGRCGWSSKCGTLPKACRDRFIREAPELPDWKP